MRLAGRSQPAVSDRHVAAAHGDLPELGGRAADELETACRGNGWHESVSRCEQTERRRVVPNTDDPTAKVSIYVPATYTIATAAPGKLGDVTATAAAASCIPANGGSSPNWPIPASGSPNGSREKRRTTSR